jgi:phosphonatase-like hydrolase
MSDELRLVVFDLIGTTIQDTGFVARVFEDTLASYALHPSREQIARVRGLSKRQAIADLLAAAGGSDLDRDAVYTAFHDRLRAALLGDDTRAIPGADALFQSLRRAGVRIALNTGMSRDIVDPLLGSLGWTTPDVVDAVVTGDDVRIGRPAPDLIFRAMDAVGETSVHNVANVGDTVLDLQAGQNAGTRWNIGVLSGAHDAARLAAAPHTHVVDSVASRVEFREWRGVGWR